MEWLADFGTWFGLVAVAFGGHACYRHYLSPGTTVHRKLVRSERRVRQLGEITERFERLQVEQRSVEARQAALDTNNLEHLGALRQLCADLAARAEVERRVPGSTTLERDIESLLDAAASLDDEYSRSASLGHILELYVRAGLHEQARTHARWVTDAAVRRRLNQDPNLAPILRHDGPAPLLLRPPLPAAGGEADQPSSEPKPVE